MCYHASTISFFHSGVLAFFFFKMQGFDNGSYFLLQSQRFGFHNIQHFYLLTHIGLSTFQHLTLSVLNLALSLIRAQSELIPNKIDNFVSNYSQLFFENNDNYTKA